MMRASPRRQELVGVTNCLSAVTNYVSGRAARAHSVTLARIRNISRTRIRLAMEWDLDAV